MLLRTVPRRRSQALSGGRCWVVVVLVVCAVVLIALFNRNLSWCWHLPPSSSAPPARACPPSVLPGSPLGGGQPVQYIHIPKAGGTTINSLLQAYSANHSFNYTHYYYETLPPPQHSRDGRGYVRGVRPAVMVNAPFDCPDDYPVNGIFTGHRQLGFCRRLLLQHHQEHDIFYMATFRDPVERVVSEFDYMMRRYHTELRPTAAADASLTTTFATISPWVQDYWNNRTLSDLVVEAYELRRRIKHSGGGGASFTPMTKQDHKATTSANKLFEMCTMQTKMLTSPSGKRGRTALQQALDNVDRLNACFAIPPTTTTTSSTTTVEYTLDDQVRWQLLRHFGIAHEKQLPRHNAHQEYQAAPSTLTAEAHRILHAWTGNDRLVFERAVNRTRELTKQARQACEEVE